MNFSKGGICKFGKDKNIGGKMVESLHGQREGWFGWVGTGGCVMQWHPELKIGFSYMPTDYLKHEIHSNRAAFL